jgi:predicted MFS family arabinose efflux permease
MSRTSYLAAGAALLAYGICVAIGSVVGGLFAAAGAAVLVVGWRRKEDGGDKSVGFKRDG